MVAGLLDVRHRVPVPLDVRHRLGGVLDARPSFRVKTDVRHVVAGPFGVPRQFSGPLDVRHRLEDAFGDPFVVVDPFVSVMQIFRPTWCSSCGSEILNYILLEMYNFYMLAAAAMIKLDLGLLENARYIEDRLHQRHCRCGST